MNDVAVKKTITLNTMLLATTELLTFPFINKLQVTFSPSGAKPLSLLHCSLVFKPTMVSVSSCCSS